MRLCWAILKRMMQSENEYKIYHADELILMRKYYPTVEMQMSHVHKFTFSDGQVWIET